MHVRHASWLLLLFASASCADEARPIAEPGGSTPALSVSSAAREVGSVAAVSSHAPPEGTVGAPGAPSSASSAPSSSGATSSPSAPSSAPSPTTSAGAATVDKPDTQGEQKKFPAFTAYLAAKGVYKVGQPAAVTAVVSALDPFHVNQEYPYKFKLADAPAGISYPEAIVRNVARTQMRATLTIPFTPSQAGKATISGECSLSVCNEASCVIEKVPLAVLVNVEN